MGFEPRGRKEWIGLLLLVAGAFVSLPSLAITLWTSTVSSSGPCGQIAGYSWGFLILSSPVIYRFKKSYGKIAVFLVCLETLLILLFPKLS
jgi:hypothetical protein